MLSRSIRSLVGSVARRRSPRAEVGVPRTPDELPELFSSIGIDRDYSALDLAGLEVDTKGWGSTHPVFEHVVGSLGPAIVIEVGTWKGASLLHMHELSLKHGCDTSFICIDTWLGSTEVWLSPERRSLMIRGGYPSMFRQFAFNVLSAGAAERVFPMPMTSSAAARILGRLGVVADAIYIDASHEEEDVALDVALFYELLRPGGTMFGDDYDERWPGVIRAVEQFRRKRGLDLEVWEGKWMISRPTGK